MLGLHENCLMEKLVIERSFVAMKASLKFVIFLFYLNSVEGKFSFTLNRIEVNSTKPDVVEILYVEFGKTTYNISALVKKPLQNIKVVVSGFFSCYSKIKSHSYFIG